MTSRALFISVALSMVIRGPMTQRGWRRACSTVTSASSRADRPRKGPPEAVSTRRRTPARGAPSRHWAMAECSLSTGRMRPPARAQAAFTRCPARTRLSLLARARSAPCSAAARVDGRPAAPVIPATTMSGAVSRTRSTRPSGPEQRRVPGGRSTCCSPTRQTASGFQRRACSPSRSADVAADRPTTRWVAVADSRTSRVWRPMEPVEPRTRTRLVWGMGPGV